MPYAGMAELADALDLGSSGQPCGFDSHYPYHVGAKFALLRRFLCPRQKDVICSLPCAPLQIAPTVLGFDLILPLHGTFSCTEILILAAPRKRKT